MIPWPPPDNNTSVQKNRITIGESFTARQRSGRKRQLPLCVALSLVFLAVFSAPTTGQTRSHTAEQIQFFESKIRPVLVKHCYECHSSDSKILKGGLALDSREATLLGGDSGPAIVPGKLEESLVWSALQYEDFEMPPAGKLSPQILNDFKKWILAGAADPRTETTSSPVRQGIDWQKAKTHWSFQAPVPQPLPQVQDSSWSLNRIDRFILSRIESQGLAPAPIADRRQLIRRLSFDLTGLPPKSSETEIAPLIETLLASPAFGEKWGRLWLDIARYAEDQAHIVGNNQSLFYPNAYLYRDWVIQALNDDKPYDEFIVEQLANDLLAKRQGRQLSEQEWAALGFIGLGPKYYRRNDPAVMADEWEDRVDTVSRGLLGLTVACARCHDHKYDPISTEDYYALAGVFASTEMYNLPMSQIAGSQQAGEKKKKTSPKESLHVIRDRKPRDLNVLIRGDVNSKGKLVDRRFLKIFDAKKNPFPKDSSGRLELARTLTDPSNPLVARVIVNRVWNKLIGKPIVGTLSNFGELGERPSHPQLLDDLSARFMMNEWSLKWLIREIVSSQTYRQSSVTTDAMIAKDPANRYWARMSRKRLSIEQWRDSILQVNERLCTELGGTSIHPEKAEARRRTIYSSVSRFQLNPMLAMFDFPDPNAHAANRSQTISPLQKMFALNSPFLLFQADALGKRLADQVQPDEFIDAAYSRLFQRVPSQLERKLANRFLSQNVDTPENNRVIFLQTLLISNEFTYID